MKKFVLISVTNKLGVVELARGLKELDYQILSTGNTNKLLSENNIESILVEEVTKFPEILSGRVKTLHPKVHGGILYKRDSQQDLKTIKEFEIPSIDIVISNLYAFEDGLKNGEEIDLMVEKIDIGGPSMIRAAAKNFKDVLVVVDPNDYIDVLEKLNQNKNNYSYRLKMAMKAFGLTAHYDSIISQYFNQICDNEFPTYLNLTFEKNQSLRYGENPHQNANWYKDSFTMQYDSKIEQLHGKELSFNNINDLNCALDIMKDFDQEIMAVAVKHANPCAAAKANNIFEAMKKCYNADSLSIFGGIVGLNDCVDEDTAKILSKIFLEIVVAPEFSKEALEILKQKKNLRILKWTKSNKKSNYKDLKYLNSNVLIQSKDDILYQDFETVTQKIPTKEEIEDMIFGMKIAKNLKSNAIAIVKNGETIALGAGQTSRVWALENAIRNQPEKDFEGAILASDAFFPFDDCVKIASKVKISAIIQPGGSIKDQDSIDACNENQISMIFTKTRHFKH